MTMTEERFYTAEEVAERLHVQAQTVRMWLRDGRMRGFHPGGRTSKWLVRASALDQFVAEREAEEHGTTGEEP